MSITNSQLKKYWACVVQNFGENLEETAKEFEFDILQMNKIDEIPEDQLFGVAFDLTYMVLNGYLGSDFETTYDF